MRMGFLADKITGPARKCLEIAIDLLTFAFAGVVMVYGGISITKLTMIQTTASLRVPMGYILSLIHICQPQYCASCGGTGRGFTAYRGK